VGTESTGRGDEDFGLKRSLSLGELLWRFFGKDVGEFGSNDDVTFVQPHLQKKLERRIHSSRGDVSMNRQDESE
jgi:hypothetical protein